MYIFSKNVQMFISHDLSFKDQAKNKHSYKHDKETTLN